jgi:hypothetical protein
MGVRDVIAKALMGIKAYHSSPHDFERFDLSKIGTGEGAQAYGHGIYAAENPAISGQGGQYWKSFLGRFGPQEQVAAKYLSAAGQDHDRARQMLLEGIKRDSAEAGYLDSAYHRDDLAAVKLLESKGLVGPRTYELNINADPAQMLDWDKPLSQQSPSAQQLLLPGAGKKLALDPHVASIFEGNPANVDAATAYRAFGRAPVTSQALNEAGIPGIKYLDAGSRGAGQGSSNYVVFDPSIIDIMRKYGIAGAAAAPAVGAAMGSTYDQNQYEAPP